MDLLSVVYYLKAYGCDDSFCSGVCSFCWNFVGVHAPGVCLLSYCCFCFGHSPMRDIVFATSTNELDVSLKQNQQHKHTPGARTPTKFQQNEHTPGIMFPKGQHFVSIICNSLPKQLDEHFWYMMFIQLIWEPMCCSNILFTLNPLPHLSHLNLYWPVCSDKWYKYFCLSINCLGAVFTFVFQSLMSSHVSLVWIVAIKSFPTCVAKVTEMSSMKFHVCL